MPIGTKGFKYEMGNAAETAFEIICGYNGYITTLDDGALELGNNFDISASGYFDTTQVGDSILSKADAFDMWVSDTGEITAAINDATTNMPQTLFDLIGGYKYYPVGVGTSSSGSTTINKDYSIAPTNGTMSKLYADGTASKTITLYVNGLASILTCTTGVDGKGYDLSHTVDISVGDTLQWYESSFSFSGEVSVRFESDNPKEIIYMQDAMSLVSGLDWYTELYGGWLDHESDKTRVYQVVTGDCTLTKLYITLEFAPGAGKSWDFTVLVNGIPSSVTVHIDEGNTTGSDIAHTADISAGDTICLFCDGTGGPLQSSLFASIAIEPDNDYEYYAISGGYPGPVNNATQYCTFTGGTNWSNDATQHSIINRYTVISDMMFEVPVAPGAGKSWTFTLLLNGNPTDLSVTIANAATAGSDLTHSVAVVPGDVLMVKSVPSGTPAACLGCGYGFTLTENDFGCAVVADVPTGEHDIVIGADATNMTFELDGVTEDTTLLNAASVPDNANDYVWIESNTMPYAEYLKMAVNGSDILWYQPNDIIHEVAGDWTLPDRQGAQQEGIITWGTNPVTVTVGALVGGVVEPTNTATNITTLPPIVPPGETSPIITQPPVTSSIFNPFFDVIDDLTDHKFTPEWQGMAYATLLCAGFIIFVGSRTQSFFLAVTAGGLGLGLGYLLRFFADLWIFWVFGFLAIAALLLDARKSW